MSRHSNVPKAIREELRLAQIKDNNRILQLQEDYFLMRCFGCHKNSPTETELIKAMQACAQKFIYYEREKRGFYISAEDVEIKSLGASAYIMEQYYKRPDFRLGTPSAYIRLRVLSELYRHKKIDEYISYSDREF